MNHQPRDEFAGAKFFRWTQALIRQKLLGFEYTPPPLAGEFAKFKIETVTVSHIYGGVFGGRVYAAGTLEVDVKCWEFDTDITVMRLAPGVFDVSYYPATKIVDVERLEVHWPNLRMV